MKTGFNFQPEYGPLQKISRNLWIIPKTINTTRHRYPDEIWEQLPVQDIATKLAILVPIVVFGVVGNLALLEVIVVNRSLRTPTHLLIANLALVDVITLLLCPPMFLLHDFYQNYVLGPVGCKLEGLIEGGLLITSILTLCVISYDRLAAIVLPSKARLKERSVTISIVLCWCLGFAAALPLAIYRNHKERIWRDFSETFCSEDKRVLPLYLDLLIVLLVWMPLGVMLASYTAILCKLDQYERKAKNREHPMVVRYKSRVAKTLFFVVISFVMMRLPFTVMIMLYYKDINLPNFRVSENFVLMWWITKVLFIFLFSAFNPLIYGLTNNTFRKAFKNSRIMGTIWRFREKEVTDDSPMTVSRKALVSGNEGQNRQRNIVATWLWRILGMRVRKTADVQNVAANNTNSTNVE
ncbi:neuropeptide Y receptor type 2-like [Toxorhynchites rutilus septentrionalis]|uniref:neuropeptide Y receptor type 2-like n=1 Tax=Toxorhynchites rutilus septentrionalis TaxID=329112 RepID=UPI0024796F19|nr:neuropeptide Y receptor type 2-like [Toxorhynchites rutilus septentrionalis]XP_055626108.1 neuropeptide Y receptor type 2-like [Toxorhynchites rutilus septentrionalis]XP_055626109.1 neuropeptide Y receptor type 2-like [Toxorhynchites rutilus septentrionalis]XP_055626110.1 neuropeptide Y receptor type 2-like [Toxorhynchites rutilus septentrionalis]XP_055626111.1 neuropeptide Y receptor type 2-like [Toxorhynchites rutilus septentrionalis]XP_055626112.1 neuropeptide Y receptor type 2-like [Tox